MKFYFVFLGIFFAPLNSYSVDFSACERTLVGEVIQKSYSPSNLRQFLESASRSAQSRIRLPFTMSPSYNARLLQLPEEDLTGFQGATHLYLAFSEKTEIVKIQTNVLLESWHGAKITIDGFHFVLGFNSEQARAQVLETMRPVYGSVSVGDLHKPFTGEFGEATGTQFALIFPSPESYSIFLKHWTALKSDSASTADSPIDEVNFRDLEALSDFHERTSGGTIYFYKDRQVIGYFRRGHGHIIAPRAADYANFASHLAILQRQRGTMNIERAPPLDPLAQFRYGRQLLDDALASLSEKTQLPRETIDREQKASDTNVTSIAISLNAADQGTRGGIPGQLGYLAKKNIDLLKAKFEKLPDPDKAPLRALGELSSNILPLIRGEPNSVRYLRFIRFPKTLATIWGFVYTDLGSNLESSTLLHDQILRAALGKALTEKYLTRPHSPNPLSEFITGGVLSITYNGSGKALRVEILQSEISLPAHNPIESAPLRMTPEDQTSLIEELERYFSSR